MGGLGLNLALSRRFFVAPQSPGGPVGLGSRRGCAGPAVAGRAAPGYAKASAFGPRTLPLLSFEKRYL